MRSLFRRLVHQPAEPDRRDPPAAEMDGLLHCATCGTPLGFDPEDEPDGDAGQPICGECNRSRNFDVMLEGELHDG